MSTMLSPGVNVNEIDLTTIVPTVSTSAGAFAGIFNWGPVGERILVDSENALVNTFGKPNSNNAETWFTAANFLSYNNTLYVVRAANTTSNTSAGTLNAFANSGVADPASVVVKNRADYEAHGAFNANVYCVARYPGALGNSLKISFCDSVNAFSSSIALASNTSDVTTVANVAIGSNTMFLTFTSAAGNGTLANTYANTVLNSFYPGDYIAIGNTLTGTQYLQISNIGGFAAAGNTAVATISFYNTNRLASDFGANSTVNSSLTRYWEFFNVISSAPSQTNYVANFGNTAAVDALHVVVVDENGLFTGVPGTILETYQNLSRATDAKTTGGVTNYYKTVINQNSNYTWIVNDRSGSTSANATLVTTSSLTKPLTYSMTYGQDGPSESSIPLSVIASGYDMFASKEDIDISLVLGGKPIGGTTTSGGSTVSNFQSANYIIDNITSTRKDCVAFITPDDSVITNNLNNIAPALVNWRNVIHDSSYAVIDSGYKYQYDRYNDVYRWLPTNGDIAGLCARTDNTNDPWWSPAGFNRGQIKNLIKMRYNPRQAERDLLFSNSINPVVSFPGKGTILYGDKTLQSKPSAFDHINVRRLFIVLEKAISTAAKYTLFEFNDDFTRSQFKNLVVPYLRDVKARRGITDFLVVCDSTNNTPVRIDRNEFWGDIYIKPARSINFIQLNFVAVATGVQFTEVVGKF